MNPLNRIARAAVTSAPARRLFLDRQLAFWLGELDASWSLEPRGRVVTVIRETRDVKTFVMRPNASWRGHRAGQHTTVEVEMGGVRVRRCYSISSGPAEALVSITVKRAGRVSSWLHDNVRPGAVLRLQTATGDFVLPEPAPQKLLLLSGGSGITPVMSMLRDLAARRAIRDVVFVHHARSENDVIFRRELRELLARHAGLRLVLRPGLFDEGQLGREVPDFAERETFLCGPPGLMARVNQMWDRMGAGSRLHRERFSAPPRAVAGGPGGCRVTLSRSDRSFTAGGSTLLVELERAGARPAHGCRMGICGTCKSRKLAGAVQNALTGVVSSEPDEDIQLCISVPRSDVELAL